MDNQLNGALDLLSTQVVDHDGVAVVVMAGEVDTMTQETPLTEAIDALSRTGAGLVMDLRAVTFFGSSGINLLVAVQQQAHRAGFSLAVVAAQPAVLRPLAITGVDTCLAIFANVPDALAAVRAEASVPLQERR
jgi:anti-anti-sigma factor